MPRLRLRPLERKFLPCLRCGRVFWTDAAHRFCRKCLRQTRDLHCRRTYGTSALQSRTPGNS